MTASRSAVRSRRHAASDEPFDFHRADRTRRAGGGTARRDDRHHDGRPPDDHHRPRGIQWKTQVEGAIPDDLPGRWLFVADVRLPDGRPKPVARTGEIKRTADGLDFRFPYETLPTAINQKVEAASQKTVEWEPTREDLELLAAEFGKGQTIALDVRAVETKVIAADKFPPEFTADEATKDSKFAISVTETYSGRQGAIKSFTSYGVREYGPQSFGGGFVTTTLAAAPLPVPITLKGDFKAYRLGGASQPSSSSWLQKLFSGCGRTK